MTDASWMPCQKPHPDTGANMAEILAPARHWHQSRAKVMALGAIDDGSVHQLELAEKRLAAALSPGNPQETTDVR